MNKIMNQTEQNLNAITHKAREYYPDMLVISEILVRFTLAEFDLQVKRTYRLQGFIFGFLLGLGILRLLVIQ